jgi:hypothetical protein
MKCEFHRAFRNIQNIPDGLGELSKISRLIEFQHTVGVAGNERVIDW